jgi:hypothetical protein
MANPGNPFGNFDPRAFMDMGKLGATPPALDMGALVEAQRRNVEALTRANQVAAEGMQALAQRHAEMLRQGLDQAGQALRALMAAGSPEDKAAQQADIARDGFARESIDLVAMTHIEGVGMVASRDDEGGWQPFFPNARILVSDEVLMAFLGAPPENDEAAEQDLQYSAWSALIEQGRVATFADADEIVPGMRAAVRHGHCDGHAVFHFVDRDAAGEVAFLGHLAVSPLHLATGPCAALNEQADDAWVVLQDIAATVPTLIGPLWPAPGDGRWQQGRLAAGN